MFQHLFWAYNRNLRPEFFPGWLCYISVRMYAFFKFLTSRNPLWFTATNPGFPLWWLYPSSKRDILKQLPPEYVPETLFVDTDNFDVETLQAKISSSTIEFPLIIKPDNGLRGLGIQIFHTQQELDEKLPAYVEENIKRWAWLVQAFIDYPLELWVFYIRKPNEQKWTVTWIVEKEFLEVIWDGKKTFQELVNLHPRAKYHRELLKGQFASLRTNVINEWEKIDVVEIWTHSRGSTFLDASDIVTPELTKLFDTLSDSIDGFYYGRYDVRVKSVEWLLAWGFKIMEINPTYGEPTWMYDPGYSFWKQQKILLRHWSQMYEVATQNHANWISYASVNERRQASKDFNRIV